MIDYVRRELPADADGIRELHERAFGQPHEGRLIDALRASSGRRISLVAERDGLLAGHIWFSPVTIESLPKSRQGMGLGPVAVLPEFQRQGIGSQLIRAGLDECRSLGEEYVVVLGHVDYYPRFGFVAAATKNLSCVYPAPPGAFMVLELREGALTDCHGVVHYGPEFAALA